MARDKARKSSILKIAVGLLMATLLLTNSAAANYEGIQNEMDAQEMSARLTLPCNKRPI